MNFLRYSFWPMVKNHLLLWWWIIRYGGKKNIPREVIFKKIEETAQSFAGDMQDVMRTASADISEEERLQLRELMMRSTDLTEEIKKLKK